ncbi:hypothetical protein V6N11_070650 [Hibiscus sabdariffa]|uniref:Uncharacterized protein n=1 Tax=Hibiscus sabdariffa TaxID=183260 RepID=A0ABR2QFM8_9ROSI
MGMGKISLDLDVGLECKAIGCNGKLTYLKVHSQLNFQKKKNWKLQERLEQPPQNASAINAGAITGVSSHSILMLILNVRQLDAAGESNLVYLAISEPGFDPGTCGLWAHHASAVPL